MNELELFAGAGGGILGSMLLGHRTVCAVEYDAYARSVLLARQNDGTFPTFPVWDDVRTFDGNPWRGIVDCVSGGFPCQDISAAGKGAGIEGERSGLWKEMARIICEVRPRYAFIENSPMLVTRGLDVVLSDLAAMGFDARWGVVSASSAGAPHQRERLWVLADSMQDGRNDRMERDGNEQQGNNRTATIRSEDRIPVELCSTNSRVCYRKWPIPPGTRGMVVRVANDVERLAAIGNGQVPRVRAAAWSILSANP